MPAARQVVAGGDLDHWHWGQAVGRAAAGGENMQSHAGRQLQRTADKGFIPTKVHEATSGSGVISDAHNGLPAGIELACES